MSPSYRLLVGIDWATQEHRVCLLTPDGTITEECVVEHSAQAIHDLLERLVQQVAGQPEQIAVAIETPRGALVETMVERGLHVYTLNPKQADRFRDRHTVAGAKDDRRDAYVLGDALRTDRPKFRRVEIEHPLVIQICELSRADDDLRDEFVRLTNRFREQIYRAASPLLQLSPTLDEPWFWDLVERLFQKPERRLTRLQVNTLLRRHRIRRLDADQVLQVVHQDPVPVSTGSADATRSHIALLLPRLRVVHEQRKQCGKWLRGLLKKYGAEDEVTRGDSGPSDVNILLSLPGVGTMVAATLLGRASSLLAAADRSGLRALTGVAPVTIQSGKDRRGRVVMRRACDMSLRNACYHWSRTSTQHDDRARAYYANQRARGHSHGRALRNLADRWLRILMAMMETRTLYDPAFPRSGHQPPHFPIDKR